MIIDKGRILKQGTLDELLNEDADKKLIAFTLKEPVTAEAGLTATAPFPLQWDFASQKGLIAMDHIETRLPEFLDFLKQKNLHLRDMECRRKTLDDLFTSMTGRRLHE